MIADRELEEADYITANLTRNAGKPLTRMEEARAYKRLNEEFGLSHAKIGEMVGRSDTHIGRRIKLLALSDSDQKAVDEKKLNLGDAEQKADEQREEQTPEAEKPKKARVQPMMKRRTIGASLQAILTGEYEMPSDQALFQGVATGMVMVLFNMDIDDAKVKVVELQGVFKNEKED